MKTVTWIVIGAIVAVLAAALVLVKVFRDWNLRKKGLDGTKRVEKLLKNFAGIRQFRVLSNLEIPYKNETVKIDHLLIGFFGIILVSVRNAKGEIYGSGRDKNWVRVVTKHEQEKRGTFANPIMDNQKCLEALREVLISNNVFKITIEPYIVFANKKAVLNTENGLPVLTFKQFKKLLGKAKYSADGDVDVEKLAGVIEKAAK